MLFHLHPYILEIKLTIVGLIGLGAFIADTSDALGARSLEDMSLKVICLLAVIFIGRLFLQSQKEHKAEMTETWRIHKEEADKREDKMVAALEKHSVSLERIADLNEEQLLHFRSFVKGAVDDKMKTHS